MADFTNSDVLFAFGLTLIAGLATGIGSFIAFVSNRTNTTLLSAALSFSAGAMIYISFIEIFPKANDALAQMMPKGQAYALTTAAFFAGMFVIALIDKFVPHHENPHELHKVEEMEDAKKQEQYRKLYQMGMFTAIAIAIHNFPEGLATFTSALQSPELGLSVMLAIAVHNIPEGIAVAVPIFFATGSRWKAFKWSFLSGLSEPLGALIGYVLLMNIFNDFVFGILFSMVGGIMVFISLDQLLPAARTYGHHHVSVYSMIVGMIVMSISLIAFAQ
ncbi:MAG: zinc transporter ZupT [Pseudomonadota bacterium]